MVDPHCASMTRLLYNPIRVALTSVILFTLCVGLAVVEARAVSVTTSTTQSATHNDRATSLIAEGVAALDRNDVATAQAAFERALAINPKDATAHTYLGILADRSGNLSEAEKQFAAATACDPQSPAAHNNYGAILVKMGRAEQAAAEFELSLKLKAQQP